MGAIARSLKLHGGLPTGTAVTIENAIDEILNVSMIDAPDVSGGATTQTVGFQITDFAGAAKAGEFKLEMGAFDDADLGVSSVIGKLATATKGSIVANEGTSTIKVKTDATGAFECTLTGATGFDIFLGCAVTFGGSVLDCRSIDSVTFS